MARLSPISFCHRSRTDERFEFKAETSVDQSGTFALVVPEALAATAQGLVQQPEWKGKGVHVVRAKVNWRVETTSLDLAKKFIEAAMADFMAVEVTEEMVIVYRQNSQYAAYRDETNGSLYPNGYCVENDGNWVGTLSGTTSAPQFSVGMAARAFRKITYTRPGSTKVVYERLTQAQEDAHPAADYLNRFVGLNLAPSGKGGHSEMPYSDAAAQFFTQSLLRLCELAQRLEYFFKQPEQLQAAIEHHMTEQRQGATPLLGKF
jgi:hypothetical protein